MAHRPVGSGVSVALSGATTVSTGIITHFSDTVRVVPLGGDAHVVVGTDPTASNFDYYVPSGGSATLSLGRPKSQKVVGVTTGATTIIDFPAGTGSPFGVGDAVSLTATNQSYWDFTHKTVSSVNNTADNTGYFNTRIVVDNDYGVGYAHTALDATNPGYSWAELRGSFKVAALTSTGSGTIYAQQVQVTGDA